MNLVIRDVRIRKGWSQKYVADKIGVTLSLIQKIETGKRKPSYDVLVKLEDLFHMNHRKLFGAATPDTPSITRPKG